MKFKFNISRRTWVFGGSRFEDILGRSRLLNAQGKRCCLGQICKHVGVQDKHLLGVGGPSDITATVKLLILSRFEDLLFGNVSGAMMRYNDLDTLSLAERERKIINTAELEGCEIEFVGEYPKEILERESRLTGVSHV